MLAVKCCVQELFLEERTMVFGIANLHFDWPMLRLLAVTNVGDSVSEAEIANEIGVVFICEVETAGRQLVSYGNLYQKRYFWL